MSLSQLKVRLVLRPKTNRVDATGNVKSFDNLLTSKKNIHEFQSAYVSQ